MTKYCEDRTKLRGNGHKVSGQDVGDFFRRLYPSKTAERVAFDLNVSATTALAWIEGRSLPGFRALWLMLDFYGPEFAAAVFGLAWMKEAARTKQLADARRDRDALDARIARLSR